MKKVFSKQFMIKNKGCYSLEKLNNCSFMKLKTINLQDIVNSEISLKDKFWFCCNKVLNKSENQQFAIKIAEIILPIFEQKHPDDKRPREAIQAAKDYLNKVIKLEQLYIKRHAAAVAADADADVAAVAAAAAAAAYAAATTYAAAAADAATTYAAAAADAYNVYTEKLFNYLIDFCK